jgi:hypothetical protein
MPLAASGATIVDWNKENVLVGSTPPDGETGVSVVYDQVLNPDGSVPGTASSSGQIVFTPPEAESPGIKVVNDPYADTGGGSTLTLDGCIMTSSGATCTSPFQSGKRIKQQVTGLDPVDLVFDVEPSASDKSYQVFGRLINVTGQELEGFKVELGFGLGDDFVAAGLSDNLSFSTEFTAQPNNSGLSSTSQFPFGLFGLAEDNPNFLLDGFFDTARTGFNIDQSDTELNSAGFYGSYETLFGPWLSQADVPEGLFWDFDSNPETDNLLMAWEISPGIWELRREATETCDPDNPSICVPGATLPTFVTGSLAEIYAELGVDPLLLGTGGIEDLANLNLNYAILLGDLGNNTSFTLRTTVTTAPIPLPAAAPLLVAGLGLMAFVRGRRRAG